MPNAHAAGKRQHKQWFTDEEWESLVKTSRLLGTDVTGLMRHISTGYFSVMPTAETKGKRCEFRGAGGICCATR